MSKPKLRLYTSSILVIMITCLNATEVFANKLDCGRAKANSEFKTSTTEIAKASRFLQRASLGTNLDDIYYVNTLGTEAWINEQLQLQPTLLMPYLLNIKNIINGENIKAFEKLGFHIKRGQSNMVGQRNLSTAWLRSALRSCDFLRQRVAWALSQIFVVSTKNSGTVLGAADYYDLLLINAFGNYSDLLLKISKHSMMGKYLSYSGNKKADTNKNIYPDENYAREILQLFSIGLWELNEDGSRKLDNGIPIATYENSDIETIARIFTGLRLPAGDQQLRHTRNMVTRTQDHDYGAKVALGGLINIKANTLVLDEIKQAVSSIANHSNTAPFISRKLIKLLVSSNPSPQYIKRVTTVWKNTSGDLGEVVRSILLDKEAEPDFQEHLTAMGRLKDPIQRFMQLLRSLDCGTQFGLKANDLPGLQWWNPKPLTYLAQEPMRAPSVFGFFQETYSKPGELQNAGVYSPEFKILDDSSIRLMHTYIWDGLTKGFHKPQNSKLRSFQCDLSVLNQLYASNKDAFIEKLSLTLTGAKLSKERFIQIESWASKYFPKEELIQAIVFGIYISPEAALQR